MLQPDTPHIYVYHYSGEVTVILAVIPQEEFEGQWIHF